MTQEKKGLPHSLALNERKALTMSGVSEVLSFDDTVIVLKTDLGVLQIQGRQLQLKELSRECGDMAVEGYIQAMQYAEPKQGGFFSRLLG